jgi:putative transposase
MEMPNRKSYDTDLTDAEWELICPFLPRHPPRGNDPRIPKREIINAIFYINRQGCAWRSLPHDFPNWSTVYGYFRMWTKAGIWQQINDTLRREVRQQAGKNAEPTAAIIDSQSVKVIDQAGPRGYDAGKKVNGRKRHILVDTLGLLLAVVVHSAAIQDRDGAKWVFLKAATLFPTISLVWADGGYAGQLIGWLHSWCGWILDIVRRAADQVGFQIVKKRWIVERTLGWLGHYRRLSKDYEEHTENSEAMIQIAMIQLMLHRLCRPARRQRQRC